MQDYSLALGTHGPSNKIDWIYCLLLPSLLNADMQFGCGIYSDHDIILLNQICIKVILFLSHQFLHTNI